MNSREFMQQAVDLAVMSVTAGGRPFGAVIVCDGAIAASGQDTSAVSLDPTDHAELSALRSLVADARGDCLDSATLYASCEPCLMCAAALARCPIPVVYFGVCREDAAAHGFADIAEPEVARTVLRATGKTVKHLPVDNALEPFRLVSAG